MSNKLRFILLVLLSLTSVFFAEIIAGSSKYPLFDLWGLLVVIPLYGLHIIILLYIINRFVGNKQILFSTMYFAGVIFGLYEAYITKVLFVGLGEDSYIVFGIALLEFIVLVFFWHPIFAFIIPALVFEGFMTTDSNIYEGLPNKLKQFLSKKSGRLAIFIIIGMFLSLNSSGFIEAFLSGISVGIPVVFLYYILRKKGVHTRYSLGDILPDKKTMKVLVILLGLMYLIMGIFIDPEALKFSGQFMILIIYIVFGFIFFTKLIKNKLEMDLSFVKDAVSIKYMMYYIVIIIFTGSAVSLLWSFGLRDYFMVSFWIIWVISGITLFIYNYKR